MIAECESPPRVLNRIGRRLQPVSGPILLGLLCLLVYNANLRQIAAGDTLPARYLPFGLWRFGTLTLDPMARWVAHGHPSIAEGQQLPASGVLFSPQAYWMIRGRNHHLVSFYPVVAPLLVAPLYLPAVAYLSKREWRQPEVDRVAQMMEKLSASVLAALATVVLYLVLRREANPWSFAIALAFAFGTNTWMTSSQALWQHGAGECLIALALLLSVSPPAVPNGLALGAACVLIAANRPPDLLLAGAIAFHVGWIHRRAVPWLLAGAVVPLAAVLIYNVGMVGSVLGGYGTALKHAMSMSHEPVWKGIAGLIVSPTRGLLVFAPFLIFVPFGLNQRLRSPATRNLAFLLGVAVVGQLVVNARTDWRAGSSWGPRYMTDMLPVLVWMLAPAALVLQPFGRAVLGVAATASVMIQGIGAFWYTGMSDLKIFSGDPTSMRAAWDITNIPFITELRHSPVPGELNRSASAVIDRIATTPLPLASARRPVLASGSEIAGWALAGRRMPAELLLLIDGVVIGNTWNFTARSDIAAAMHTKTAAGWAITADTRNVLPGERVLQVALRLEPRSDIRIVREQGVMVVKTEAAPQRTTALQTAVGLMADAAAATLGSRQSADGYWLTSYTSEPRFEAPHLEMNTFLTAMIVDFLSPIVRERNLGDVVERARRHLVAQIENNGLVRYHGLPNAPTIGTLGCIITPDSDDTALAWRLGGDAADPRRQSMLHELEAYRDGRGLYRTWLARRDQYQCLDPGRDPNPADVTIQMHVYLMLHQFDPPAAQNLCSALRRLIGSNDVWVYYAKAPLIPFLRSVDMQRQGCAIPLPIDRLAQAEPGQEIWIDLVRRLIPMMTSPANTADREAMLDLLARLGRNDFAELRRTPPLLYHNDLSATVPRYYWSEDFGYVLWLRAYHAVSSETNPSFTTRQ